MLLGVGARVMLSYNHERCGTVVREWVRHGERIGVFIMWLGPDSGELCYTDDDKFLGNVVLAPARQVTSRLRARRNTSTRFQGEFEL